jgi:hypothetical protein
VDILHFIDRLEELVAEARRMPIGQGVVVDRRRLLELVDQLRSSVPWEVKEADRIVKEKDDFIEEARREAEGIIYRAELEAREKLDELTIVTAAEREAAAVLARAEERSRKMLEETQLQVQARMRHVEQAANNQMDEADRYALEMLRRLDAQFGAFSNTIRSGIEALEERTGEGAQTPEPQDDDEGSDAGPNSGALA